MGAPPQFNHPSNPALRIAVWMRRNLFSSPWQIVLTLLCLWLLYLIVLPLVRWALVDAHWVGTSREDCVGGGACWVFISVRLKQFLYGFYPAAERWRVNVTFLLLAALGTPLLLPSFPRKAAIAAILIFGYPILATFLLVGGVFGLPRVETSQWGGLMLTLVVAGVGIAASFPMGIVLALGRRSDLPVIRALATAFIEFVRGVPLITILFMASVMLPLFLPAGVNFDKLLRALVGVTLFAAAYMAEVVRGGLQAIPSGQYEAAASLGLGYWRIMALVVLPQALRVVIPGIVNTFIGLFKDTTLVLIIGLFDLLGIIQAAATDPNWLGFATEGYVFAGLVFWIFCFGMSRYSVHLEGRFRFNDRRLGGSGK